MNVAVEDNVFVIDAALVAGLLKLTAADVQRLMQDGRITSVCEKGRDEHQNQFRLTFFHRNRLARVNVDTSGQVLSRSVIDFGDRPLPRVLRSPAA
jgi:hypothetical protein